MKKRIGLLLTVGAVMALMVALSSGVASASHEGECTFQGGRTTCVVVVQTTETTTQECQFNQGGQRSGEREVTTTTTTTTTTVFRGRSENVESRDVQTVTTTEVGECRNVPGPR
jgi:hypothetical protein